ncbi:hypothetical protein [Streptomyces sp. NPDC058861]|uniref:hypothetical protein n=1 Tax=Streptomyces sp. NPDC058861 TaxID=3346653 RepID=UPI0036C4B18E
MPPDAFAPPAERGAALVATDSVERDGPAAEALAKAGLPVLTGLTGLADLPAVGARLHAVPHPAGHGDGDGDGARVYGVAE